MSIRLVLAEDQAMVLSAFATLLSLEEDLEVVGRAADGDEALQLVAEHAPDVIVTDIEMPNRTGLDVAAGLRERGLATRVVIVTTFARSGYLRRALEAGVHGYVLKDAPVEQLAQVIRRVDRGERVIDPQLAAEAWGGTDPLTDREREVLRLVEHGHGNVTIASELHLAEGTVRNYLSTAMTKLGAPNRARAAYVAREHGWL
ncbi:MAG: response regulator transcription factor [Nitriliruptoraceae bacterium]|nr:response regulator transcription factor [Nitriliruptoraceae bacterium]